MIEGFTTFEYLREFSALHDKMSDILNELRDEWEPQEQWDRLISYSKAAALRIPIVADEISALSTTDVDPVLVAYALKEGQLMRKAGELFDQYALYFAAKKDYEKTYTRIENKISNAFNFVFGTHLNLRQRKAFEELEARRLALHDGQSELAVARSVSSGELDSIISMLGEKYHWE